MPQQAGGWQHPYGYGASPQYGYGPPQTETLAIVALCLAIGSFLTCFVLAIAALIVASSASRALRESGGMKTGDGLNKAAKIVAWVNIGLWVGFLALGVFAAAAGA